MALVHWICLASIANAAAPVETVWIRSPRPTAALGSIARVQPDVQAVEVGPNAVVVRSAGISLGHLGLLQAAPQPGNAVREFSFSFPRKPEPATGRHPHLPAEASGAFVNGVPIYNQFEAASYRGQNLWHYDLVARNDDGSYTAAGKPRAELTHKAQPGLLEALIQSTVKHSPIVGFAFDGYPIYGPWAMGIAGLVRMRLSYKLRAITHRDQWPDGTKLAPGQYGPPVSADYPLGSFVEDYEYAAGSGDLDQYNGRFAKTPEYPAGTYAYFLATDAGGKLAFPYLLAHEFYGKAGPAEVQAAKPGSVQFRQGKTLQLDIFDERGTPIRHLEFVHERPIHLLIVSADLAEFEHVHPEVNQQGTWEVPFTFGHGGRYKVYADFTAPGSNQRLESFAVNSSGPPRPTQQLKVSAQVHQTAAATVSMQVVPSLRAGEDVQLQFAIKAESLQPYLGAWAHVVIASEGLKSFIHAHPIEEQSNVIGVSEVHSHSAEAMGLAPDNIRVATSFPAAGLYKIWVQMQVAGKVEVAPFVVRVAEARAKPKAQPTPAGAITIRITPHGFEPARVQVPPGKAVKLAFERSGEPNCGGKVVFPGLGLAREVPLGGTTVVDLPLLKAGELSFSCGMGMYRGSVVVQLP